MLNQYFPVAPNSNNGLGLGLPLLGSAYTSDGTPVIVTTLGSVGPDGQPLHTFNAPANNDWQGTTGALSNLSDNIKSDSEVQMLQLQDLVSERQQVVEQMTGMMTKEDQTLEDGAKAIGQ